MKTVPPNPLTARPTERNHGILHVIAAAVMCWFAVLPAIAQDTETNRNNQLQRLEEIENLLAQSQKQQKELTENANRLAREFTDLQAQLVAAAERIMDHEADIGRLTGQLAALEAEERAKELALAVRRTELSNVLAGLVRLSRQPPVAVGANPEHAVDFVRTSLLLAAVVPNLEFRASAIDAELEAMRGIQFEIAKKQLELNQANAWLQQQRSALAVLLDEKAKERLSTETQRLALQERASRLGAEAADLRDLMARLNQERVEPETKPLPTSLPFTEARGHLVLPVDGHIIRSYGDADARGLPSHGLTFEVPRDPQVITPHDGIIVFAEPFRTYGQLLIISHDGGYHTLIAGMSDIQGIVGQWLLAGEPVGRAGVDENGVRRIYLELRQGGEPINPHPWFVAR